MLNKLPVLLWIASAFEGGEAAAALSFQKSNSTALVPGTEAAAPVASPARIEFMTTKSRRLRLCCEDRRSWSSLPSLRCDDDSFFLSVRLRFGIDASSQSSQNSSSSKSSRKRIVVVVTHRFRSRYCSEKLFLVCVCKRLWEAPGRTNASHNWAVGAIVVGQKTPSHNSIAANSRKKKKHILLAGDSQRGFIMVSFLSQE